MNLPATYATRPTPGQILSKGIFCPFTRTKGCTNVMSVENPSKATLGIICVPMPKTAMRSLLDVANVEPVLTKGHSSLCTWGCIPEKGLILAKFAQGVFFSFKKSSNDRVCIMCQRELCMKPRERPPMGLYICRKPPWDCMFIGSPKKVPVGFYIGGIQQLRGQEEGEGGQPKVHACPLRVPWMSMCTKT